VTRGRVCRMIMIDETRYDEAVESAAAACALVFCWGRIVSLREEFPCSDFLDSFGWSRVWLRWR